MRARLIGALLAIAAVATFGGAADGQTYPTRPVTLIVPWPAGGGTDVLMRTLASASEKHLGQSFVIENRAGAAGTLGPIQMASNAKPDGYTIAQIPITVFRIHYTTRTTFDPAKDLTYVIGLTGYTFGVVVRADAPWKTFDELLADAHANPGKITYGSPGSGSSLHITMEQIAKRKGIHWVHVPFKGASDSINALLGGHIHVSADSTGWGPLVDSGKFRLLVTWGATQRTDQPPAPGPNAKGVINVSTPPRPLAGPGGGTPPQEKAPPPPPKERRPEARLSCPPGPPPPGPPPPSTAGAFPPLGSRRSSIEKSCPTFPPGGKKALLHRSIVAVSI